MPRIPLLGGAYQARSVIAEAQRCVNLYPEKNPTDAPTQVTHYPTPGLRFLTGPAPPSGGPDAVHFEGNTELDLASALVGIADSPLYTLVIWWNPGTPSAPSGNAQYIGGPISRALNASIQQTSGNQDDSFGHFPIITSAAPAGGGTFEAQITPAVQVTGWQVLMTNGDTNHADGLKITQFFIGDTQYTPAQGDGNPAFDIGFATGSDFCAWFADGTGSPDGSGLVGDVYYLWYAPGTFLDFTVTANRRKFIDGSGNVVAPPTPYPAVCFYGPLSTWSHNLGLGGAFSVAGDPLTLASTKPPGAP